jgi:hypothetical protein
LKACPWSIVDSFLLKDFQNTGGTAEEHCWRAQV